MAVISTPDGRISEDALRREVCEQLRIVIEVLRPPGADVVPYVSEEPGPYRLDFCYRCTPGYGFGALRAELMSCDINPITRDHANPPGAIQGANQI